MRPRRAGDAAPSQRWQSPCTFSIEASAYYRRDGRWDLRVAPHTVRELSWPVSQHGRWYDFAVSCGDSASFKRRFAGRVENGKDSISDPAMGGD